MSGVPDAALQQIHPDAWIAPSAQLYGRIAIAEGSSVWHNAVARAECAEQRLRDDACRVLCIAPGVVETAMQAQIRATADRDFPQAERFRQRHRDGGLSSPEDAARALWSLVVRDDLENGAVLDVRDA